MKLLVKGDRVYFVKPGCFDGAQVSIENVVFDREEDGLAYVTDSAGLHWEIPMGVVCGVPEGHVFATDLGTTSKPNPVWCVDAKSWCHIADELAREKEMLRTCMICIHTKRQAMDEALFATLDSLARKRSVEGEV